MSLIEYTHMSVVIYIFLTEECVMNIQLTFTHGVVQPLVLLVPNRIRYSPNTYSIELVILISNKA